MPSRLNPLRGLVHGSIEGLGPVPFVQPLCKHLHRPLSHRDLPSAFICALVHERERTRGCRWCFPKSVSVAENCGNCQLLQSRTFLRRCRGKPGLDTDEGRSGTGGLQGALVPGGNSNSDLPEAPPDRATFQSPAGRAPRAACPIMMLRA